MLKASRNVTMKSAGEPAVAAQKLLLPLLLMMVERDAHAESGRTISSCIATGTRNIVLVPSKDDTGTSLR